MYSPLSQFEVYEIFNLSVLNYYIVYINNLNLVVFSAVIVDLIVMLLLKEEIKIIPNKMQFYIEMIYSFVYNLVYVQMGKKGLAYFPYLLSLFVTIILLNIISLFPYSFAVTSHFIWSMLVSLSSCLSILLIGLINYKLNYFKIFLQEIPIILYPLMTVIELASYVIRAFSLAIRLSANIMAGHILVDIIAEVLAYINLLLIDLAIIIFLLIIGLFVLEIGVACLQAYVFLLLITIYMNDAINLKLHV